MYNDRSEKFWLIKFVISQTSFVHRLLLCGVTGISRTMRLDNYNYFKLQRCCYIITLMMFFVRLNVAEDDLVAANGGMGTPGHGYLSRADQEDGSQ